MKLSSFLLSLCTLLLVSPRLAAQGGPGGKTLLLLVEGDRDQLTVTSAWRKAGAFRTLRRKVARGRARLLDSTGALLAAVPVDLSSFNLDPNEKGRTIRLSADHFAGPRVHVHVKVPDLEQLSRVEFEITDNGISRKVGEVSRASVERMIADAARRPQSNVTVKTHLDSGPTSNRYDIVILGDGYLATDQTKFYNDVSKWMVNLFGREPFKSYKGFFNVHSVFRPSAERGADNPRATPPVVVNTSYDASYWTQNVERCLYIKNTRQADLDAAMAPDVERSIVVFVNSPKYGGCAGKYAVTYNGPLGPQVQTHEFCHSFGGLADEYGGAGTYTGPEPNEANVTADPKCDKWALWRGSNGIACFEGGRYHDKGVFRPANDCLMRSSSVLCAVCVEHLTKVGYGDVSAIDKPVPSQTSLEVIRPATQVFRFTSLVPTASNAVISWKVNDAVQTSTGNSFSFQTASLRPGTYRVAVELRDRSALVRKDPTNVLTQSRTWTVVVKDRIPALYTTFGSSCGDSGSCQVLPRAYATKMGEGATSFPHAAANMRYQQIFLGSEIAGTNRWSQLCLRRDEFFGGNQQTQSIEVRYGDTDLTPANIGTDFDGNYKNRGGTVFRGNVNLPFSFGRGTVKSFDVCIKFDRQVTWEGRAGKNLIIEIINRSASARQYMLDQALNTNGTTTRLYAFQSDAKTATNVDRNGGIVMCLGQPNTVPVLGNLGAPRVGEDFTVTLANAASNALALLWLGPRTTIPMPPSLAPGCNAYALVNLLVSAQVTDANGAANVKLVVPNSTRIIGAKFANQWHVLQPVNNLGIVFTNGGEGRIGG